MLSREKPETGPKMQTQTNLTMKRFNFPKQKVATATDG